MTRHRSPFPASAPLVALTPNLAIDRTLRLERPLEPGTLHRVAEAREAAGGKGVNLARAVRALGGEVRLAGFVGGWNGRKFRALAEGEGLAGDYLEVAGETRECTIVLDGAGHPTEINERGPRADAAAWRELLERARGARLVVSGSLPPGLPPAALGALLRDRDGPTVVDTSGAALAAALEAGVELIAPNRAELAALLGRERVGVEDAAALYARSGVPILLSLGAAGAAYLGERRGVVAAPEVEAGNPVGSGDCLLGAFLWARARDADPLDALRWGVAAGSENARRGGGGDVRGAGIRELFERTRVEPAD